MDINIIKKKKVSYSQFSNWYICPMRWKLDYIDKLKQFEDNLIMTFGTSIHETIQLYLSLLYKKGDERANELDAVKYFKWRFKKNITLKKIPHTAEEFEEFVQDGKNIINEFKSPSNRLRYFPRDKWELLGIEDELNVDILNNVSLTAFIDIVLKEKSTGNIKIIDFKTSNSGWTTYQKEDFTKCAQLVIYKALYSKKHNIPLSKIDVEFFILRRKLYENCKYEQSRIQIFKPSAYQRDVNEVITEFSNFVNTCFTPTGIHKTDIKYSKNPNDGKNCKFCPYKKNKKCDGIAD